MRIPSGVTNKYIYFVAVDATDLKTRETGLSSFTVYRSRNGGAAAAFTTPTINETDNTNMPGVYELLLDEDMTIDSGDDSQEMVFHITHAGMAPVTRTIELYRPKITAGETLTVSSGAVSTVAAVTTVNGLANNTITAASIASDAITAAKVAADVTTEIQSGLATASALSTVDGKIDTIGGYLDTEVAAILADTDELQTDLANGGRLDLLIDAIKAKTDNLPAAPAATGDIPTATQNADALLNRDMSAVSDTNARSPLNALRAIRNKTSISGSTLTVTKEDDSTSAWTAAVTSDAAADPIIGVDPA